MKKFLSVVGALFLIAVLGAGGFVAYVMYQGKALDASSKAYVRTSVTAIVSPWSEQALLKRASPQLLKQIRKDPGKLELMFSRLSALGALKKLGEVNGEASISYNLPHDKATTAAYELKPEFANGKVDIKVRLILLDGKWKFLNFYVTAPDSLKQQPVVQNV